MNLDELRFEHDSASVSWQDVRELFIAVGWNARPAEDIERSFRHSSNKRFVYAEDRLVALGRTMDDSLYYALICDLVVAPEFQQRGIGSRILAELRDACSNFEFVTLTAAEDKNAFYLAQGWSRQKSAFIWPKDDQQARIHAE